MTNFVKVLDKNGPSFCFLYVKFLRFIKEKNKAVEFIGRRYVSSSVTLDLSNTIRKRTKANNVIKIKVILQHTSQYMISISINHHQTAYNCTAHFCHDVNTVTSRFAISLQQDLQT
jgi:hypothetical protein